MPLAINSIPRLQTNANPYQNHATPLKALLLLLYSLPIANPLCFLSLFLIPPFSLLCARTHLHVCVHTRMTKNVCKFFLKIYPKIYPKILPKIIQKFTPKSCQNFHQIYSKHYPKILPESPPYNPPKIHATLTRIESMIHAPNPCQIHAGIMPQIHAGIDSNRVH